MHRTKAQREAGACVSGKHPWVEGQIRCKECDHNRIRGRDLKKNFNISIEEYNQLLKEQNGVCAICQNECPTGRSLAVDHNHESNEIRGLLCTNCNHGLGKFKDSTKLLATAIKYLEGRNNV